MSSGSQPSHPGAAMAPVQSVSPVPGSVQRGRSVGVERGHSERTVGGYSYGMFADVTSVEGFAEVLGVPFKSIPLIIPTDRCCRVANCPFDAVEGNQDKCPAHSQSWYPLETARGGLLLGPEFLRSSI